MISSSVFQLELQNKNQSCTADGEVTIPFSVFLFNTATAEVWWEENINNKVNLSNEVSFYGVSMISLSLLQKHKFINS